MQDDFDSQLRRYYQSQRLTDDEITAVRRASKAQHRWHWLAPWSWAAAGMLVLAVTLVAMLPQSEADAKAQWLVADITRNHLAGKPSDLAEGDLRSLAAEMQSLGFGFALPDGLEAHGRVVGARLCSLAGKPAIHLYLDSQGEEKSLFVAAADNATFSHVPDAELITDLSIQSWSEQGHFYVLASSR